uniref:Uncharacterized protein n=1 Tax=Arundo donax TaxID=35708 RepID=A0A0A9HF14_ARUDO
MEALLGLLFVIGFSPSEAKFLFFPCKSVRVTN